jgi:hypothetical protein
LRACCYGAQPLGARRLLALVRHLPAAAVMRDPVAWTTSDELGAAAIETTFEIVRTLHAVMQMWADPKSRSRIVIPKPLRIPRPHDERAVEAPPPKQQWPPVLNVSSGRELVGKLVKGK